MKGDKIKYTEGYKYRLEESYRCITQVKGFTANILDIDTQVDWIRISADGEIFIREGYCWDGPSGPTIDSKDFMRGSLVHDAFYQLMRDGKIPQSCRIDADRELRDICIEDGMPPMYAALVFSAVQEFAESSAIQQDPKILVAP